MSDGDRISIKNQLVKKNQEFKLARAKFHMVRAEYPLFKAVRIFKKSMALSKAKGIVVDRQTKVRYNRIITVLSRQLKETPEWKLMSMLSLERKELKLLYEFCQKIMVEESV